MNHLWKQGTTPEFRREKIMKTSKQPPTLFSQISNGRKHFLSLKKAERWLNPPHALHSHSVTAAADHTGLSADQPWSMRTGSLVRWDSGILPARQHARQSCEHSAAMSKATDMLLLLHQGTLMLGTAAPGHLWARLMAAAGLVWGKKVWF